jgi:hypothetical protein
MKRTKKISKAETTTALEKLARRVGERVGELDSRVRPKLKKLARTARSNIRRVEHQVEVTVRDSVESARQSLRSREKAFVVGRTAQRPVCLANGRPLVFKGQRITRTMANYAERRGLLDDLFRAAGGSHAREFGLAAKDLLTAAGEQIRKRGARARRASERLWK